MSPCMREARAEQREQREVDGFRDGVRDGVAAPEHRHDLFDQVSKPEGEQDLRNVAFGVHPPEPVALDRGADQAARERRQHERGPEAPSVRTETRNTAQHEDVRMRGLSTPTLKMSVRPLVNMNSRRPYDAVQQRNGDQLKHGRQPVQQADTSRGTESTAEGYARRLTSDVPSCRSSPATWTCLPPWRPSSIRGSCPPRRISRPWTASTRRAAAGSDDCPRASRHHQRRRASAPGERLRHLTG